MTVTHDGHSPTDASARSGVTAMQRPWPLVKVNGFTLVWESLTGWCCLSSTPRELRARVGTRGSKVPNLVL
jgi:hypothetical protein